MYDIVVVILFISVINTVGTINKCPFIIYNNNIINITRIKPFNKNNYYSK